MATHYFPTDRVHFTWDAGNEPVLSIADGDTVVFETRDVSDNQIGPDSDTSVIATLDWDRVYPLSGPVYAEGAVTHFRDDITVPLDPFMGTMGVCPAGASGTPIMPPGIFGGNLDTRQLVRGTTLYLP